MATETLEEQREAPIALDESEVPIASEDDDLEVIMSLTQDLGEIEVCDIFVRLSKN